MILITLGILPGLTAFSPVWEVSYLGILWASMILSVVSIGLMTYFYFLK